MLHHSSLSIHKNQDIASTACIMLKVGKDYWKGLLWDAAVNSIDFIKTILKINQWSLLIQRSRSSENLPYTSAPLSINFWCKTIKTISERCWGLFLSLTGFIPQSSSRATNTLLSEQAHSISGYLSTKLCACRIAPSVHTGKTYFLLN